MAVDGHHNKADFDRENAAALADLKFLFDQVQFEPYPAVIT